MIAESTEASTHTTSDGRAANGEESVAVVIGDVEVGVQTDAPITEEAPKTEAAPLVEGTPSVIPKTEVAPQVEEASVVKDAAVEAKKNGTLFSKKAQVIDVAGEERIRAIYRSAGCNEAEVQAAIIKFRQ